MRRRNHIIKSCVYVGICYYTVISTYLYLVQLLLCNIRRQYVFYYRWFASLLECLPIEMIAYLYFGYT